VLRVFARRIVVVSTVLLSSAVLSAESCLEDKSASTEPKQSLDCQKGYYEVNGECVLRPDVVTVEITTGPVCPRFSPNPVALRVGQNVRWHNQTASQVIMISKDVPLTTAPPNGYSGIISFSAPETRPYGSANCSVAGNSWQIIITAG